MTVQETLRQRIDELDDRGALLALGYVEGLIDANDRDGRAEVRESMNIGDFVLENDTREDAIRRFVGMFKGGEPTNIAEHKDEYIAEAVESHFK